MSLYIELTTTDPDFGKPFVVVDGKHLPFYVLHTRTERRAYDATLAGARRLGKYIEEHHPDDSVSCSSSVDFPEECGVSISRDDFDDAVNAGRSEFRRLLFLDEATSVSDGPRLNTLAYITLAEYCRLAGLDEYTTQCALTDEGTVTWGGTTTETLVHAGVIATVLGHDLPASLRTLTLVLLP